MNRKLFDALHELFTSTLSTKIKEIDFLDCFIASPKNEYIEGLLSEVWHAENKHKILNGKKTFIDIFRINYPQILNANLTVEDILKKIAHNKNISFNKIRDELFRNADRILSLYEEYFPNQTVPATKDQLLGLFKLCITEERKRLFAPVPALIMPQTIQETIGRHNDLDRLNNLIKTESKIAISGPAGSGKTRFILYFLSQNFVNDYYYISYGFNLEATLMNIKFYDLDSTQYTGDIYDEIERLPFPNSILVIDNMCNLDNMKDDIAKLSRLNLKVIIITPYKIDANAFRPFYLSDLEPGELLDIFSNAADWKPSSSNLCMRLLNDTDRNPLLISLIGYCCKRAFKSQSAADILTQILDELGNPKRHIKNDELLNIKIKHPYDHNSLNILSHIKKVYEKYLHISPLFHNYMRYLCCFQTSILPKKFLEHVIPEFRESTLCQLSNLGLISYTSDHVYLSQIIFYATLSSEKPTPKNVFNLIQNLNRFLKTFTNELSVPFIGEALVSFANLLNGYVFLKHNPKQLNASEEYETWQTFLYLSFNYYYQLGNTTYAEDLLKILSYPKNDIRFVNNPLDKFSFQLLIDFLRTKNRVAFAEGIQSLQDKINAQCPKDECNQNLSEIFKLPTFLTIYLVQDTIDTIITNIHSEIVLHLRNHLHRELSFVSYQKCLEFLEKDLHQHLYSHKEADKYDIYKTDYYALSLVITFEKELSDDEFKRYVETTDQYENLNQRICLYAQLLNKAAVITYYSDKQIGRNGYLDLLTPVLIKLNASIACCDLIPRHTFLLCFFAYINAACCSYTLTKLKVLNPTDCSTSFRGQLSDLLKKCPFVLPEDKDRCALLLEKNHNYLL